MYYNFRIFLKVSNNNIIESRRVYSQKKHITDIQPIATNPLNISTIDTTNLFAQLHNRFLRVKYFNNNNIFFRLIS